MESKSNLLQRIVYRFEGETEILKADGLDDAVIGFESDTFRLIYSVKKCIDIFVNTGMSEDEAMEHMEYNVIGSYIGEKTPIWCWDCL